MSLTNHDREHLRQFIAHPGYKVWQQIADSYIETLQDVAIAISQNDPLANRDKVAISWAMVEGSKGYRTAVDAGVKFEIGLLTAQQQQENGEMDEERRRIWDALGMLEPMPANFHRRGDE